MSELIDRQEAIDAIRASTSKYTGFMEKEMYTDDDAVEAIEAVPAASPWHRVEEPPKEEGKYLVYDGRGIYHVAWWGPRLGWCYDPKFFCYWMPMPEPPKEDAYGN